MKNYLALIICAGAILVIFAGVASAPSVLVAIIAGFIAGQRGRKRIHE